jgi:L-lactate dehydrogenase complex protein LldG
MLDDSAARETIFERVRRANGASAQPGEAAEAWERIPRSYDAAARPQADVLEMLLDRLRDYDADVQRVTDAETPRRVQEILNARGIARVLLPSGIAPAFLKSLSQAEIATRIDDGRTAPELDAFGCILTEATLGIAETGTLVLQNVPGQGRRAASLVPDVHICILRAADVVATVPQAMRRLQSTCMLPTTFVSGPSATADIEMTRIKGVHGPRFLHVLIAECGAQSTGSRRLAWSR